MARNEPWRYSCPEGHVNVRRASNGGWHCATCGSSYAIRWDRKRERWSIARHATAAERETAGIPTWGDD